MAPALMGWPRPLPPTFDIRAKLSEAAADKAARLDGALAALEQIGTGLLSLADKPPEPQQFDALIVGAEEAERQIEALALADQKEIFDLKKMARFRRPEWLPALNDFDLHIAGAHLRMRAAYRDLRWQLMACRADHRRDERGPTFSDPAELRGYLKSSRAPR